MPCLACDLIDHPDRVPGGRIATLGGWVVEHCVGPLGIGTVIVKPLRHVVHVAELDPAEAAQLGPVLTSVTAAVTAAAGETDDPADQVYVSLWSHPDRIPAHIHFVVQPVGLALMQRFDAHGPELQLRMFEANDSPDPDQMAAAADRIRAQLALRRRNG